MLTAATIAALSRGPWREMASTLAHSVTTRLRWVVPTPPARPLPCCVCRAQSTTRKMGGHGERRAHEKPPPVNLYAMTVIELRKMCKLAGLYVSGTKAVLVERLLAAGVTEDASRSKVEDVGEELDDMWWSEDGRSDEEKEEKEEECSHDPDAEITAMDGLSVREVCEILRARGLSDTGTKEEVELRLFASLERQQERSSERRWTEEDVMGDEWEELEEEWGTEDSGFPLTLEKEQAARQKEYEEELRRACAEDEERSRQENVSVEEIRRRVMIEALGPPEEPTEEDLKIMEEVYKGGDGGAKAGLIHLWDMTDLELKSIGLGGASRDDLRQMRTWRDLPEGVDTSRLILVDGVYGDPTYEDDDEVLPMSLEEICEKIKARRGEDIAVMNVINQPLLLDYMVFCTGKSGRHLRAMADDFAEVLRDRALAMRLKTLPQVEGRDCDDWMLIDMGSVVVHFMTQEARDLYDVEMLWAERRGGFLKGDLVTHYEDLVRRGVIDPEKGLTRKQQRDLERAQAAIIRRARAASKSKITMSKRIRKWVS